jgi:hypothetical protein
MITLIMLVNMIFAQDCTETVGQEQVEKVQQISTDVPKHLVDAVIIVRTKDGRESQVSANQFKVVPRKQQFIVTETSKLSKQVCKVDVKDKNMVILGGRRDHTGLTKEVNGNVGVLSSERGAVFDAGYMRKNLFGTPLGVGGSVDTNGTLRGTVGVEF